MTEEQPAQREAPFIPSDARRAAGPAAPWRVFGTQGVLPALDRAGRLEPRRLDRAHRHPRHRRARVRQLGRRGEPGDDDPRAAGVLPRHRRRRDHRPLRPAQGDGAVRRRPGRACSCCLPFVEQPGRLVLISLGLEILTLLWGPAKAASVPNLVRRGAALVGELALAGRVATARSRSRRSSSRCSPGVATRARRARHHLRRSRSTRKRSRSSSTRCTFLVSAVDRVAPPDPAPRPRRTTERIDWTETFREIKEGLPVRRAQHALVRGVIVGLGFGLIGAGAMIPLGPSFAEGGARRRRRGVRRADDRARVRRRDRRGHAAVAPEAPAARDACSASR